MVSGDFTYRRDVVRIVSVRRSRRKTLRFMKAREFDRDFDQGKDVTPRSIWQRRGGSKQEQKRVNVDFPTWMIEVLDKEARRLGVTRPVDNEDRATGTNGWRLAVPAVSHSMPGTASRLG